MMFKLVVLFSVFLVVVHGHGRLRDPPSRSTCWRDKIDGCVPNWTDNELFCGGFDRQHKKNNGLCGICGDPYDVARPRANENGGKYGKGVVVARYQEQQQVTIKVELTASHFGYFEMDICKNNDPSQYVDPECFQTMQLADGSGTRYPIVKTGRQDVFVKVQLPQGVTCSHCVLRWRYWTGNRWGCDSEGCDTGHGPQEEFRGCADVEII